ncbi:MAG: hypothetical protein OQK32_04100 [Gammaproteobacteria bacterium]|nr:hypothetical protein [Gammaproteobacteria bacterium]MCW8922842.1 hypothetical protein [Gammaproteobacteria bacterium]
MNAFTSNASLVIHPTEPDWTPDDPEVLIKFLQEAELAGNTLNNDKNSFLVGEKFLDHISFMGCSPNIKLEDESSNGKFTFVRITTTKNITTLTGKHSFAPHCPHCKKPEKNWRELLLDNRITCSHCQQTSDAWSYNWRKSAGFGRCFIEVTDIYPKEAVPQFSLLESLEKEFGVEWGYFFYHV